MWAGVEITRGPGARPAKIKIAPLDPLEYPPETSTDVKKNRMRQNMIDTR